jgi:hypothetical protein
MPRNRDLKSVLNIFSFYEKCQKQNNTEIAFYNFYFDHVL